MKVLGTVQWASRDKYGTEIAGVRPLLEWLPNGEWRTINAMEEFPSQGLLFWPHAKTAVKDSLIIFKAEPQADKKYGFKVVDAKPGIEVLDLRRFGTASEARLALVQGIRLPGPVGTARVFAWCKPDLLVGPVEVNRLETGITKLVGTGLARIAVYTGTKIRHVTIDGIERCLRIDEEAASSFIDWDDDAVVLRRALQAAIRVAKQGGHDAGQTKKQIEAAAQTLATQGGPDALLDRYRLERALAMLDNVDAVARSAGALTDLLLEHPAIKTSIEALREKVQMDVAQSTRVELEQRLTAERAALKDVTEAYANATSQLDGMNQELRNAEARLAAVQTQFASAAKDVQAAVDARVLAAVDSPLELLAEVSVLRPFFRTGEIHPGRPPTSTTQVKVDWSRSRGEIIKDKASLRRNLTSAARARGVDPSLMLQIHAAVIARLMPITLGPAALAALTAYADSACGARMHIVHVSPSAIQPRDLDDVPSGGLAAAAAAAKDIDGISVVVLEGANRSPLEASVVPLLQLIEMGLSPLSSARGLRLAASLVTGATTVPVTPQLWTHAAAIYAEPILPVSQTNTAGDVALSSELLVPGDEPTEVVEAVLDAWPDCRELRPALSRLGAALARLHDDKPRIADGLLGGLILPFVATALTTEEQTEALGKLNEDGAVAQAFYRLRRRLI